MPAAGQEFSLVSVATVTLLAFLVPVLLGRVQRVRIPIAVGEILVGVLVGKTGLNLIQMDPVLDLLSFLGLAAIMFVSGLEIDFSLFRSGGPKPPRNARTYHPGLLGAMFLLLSFLGAYWFAGRLEATGQVESGLLTALVISTVGLSLIVPVLKERDLLDKPLGRILMVAGVLGDFLPIVGLSVLVPIYTPRGNPATVVFVAALGLIAALVYRLAQVTRRFWAITEFFHGTAQIGVRGAFALMLVFLVLAESIGVEAVLGTFLAGMLVSLLAGSVREEMVHKLDVLGFGFLTPFFFITVGIQFDLPSLLADPSALSLLPLLLMVTVLSKFLPGLLLLSIWYPLRQALAGAVLLGTQMSVTIAAAALITEAGIIPPSVGQAFILVAMVTAVLNPILFTRLLPPVAAAVGPRPIILTGVSRLTSMVAQRLQARGKPVKIITDRPAAAGEFRRLGMEVIVADPRTVEGLRQAGAEEAEALAAISGDSETNVKIARLAKDVFAVDNVLALVDEPALLGAVQYNDIDLVNPDLAAVDLVESMLVNPGVAAIVTGSGQVQAADVVLRNLSFVNRPLRSLGLPPSLLILSVIRRGEKIIPHGDTVLRAGDRLTLMGPPDDIEVYRRLLTSNGAGYGTS